MTKYYKLVTYNGSTGHFSESAFVDKLEDAKIMLEIECYDIIDDFAHDGIRMKVLTLGIINGIRIFDVNDEKNYYVVFLKKVDTED